MIPTLGEKEILCEMCNIRCEHFETSAKNTLHKMLSITLESTSTCWKIDKWKIAQEEL